MHAPTEHQLETLGWSPGLASEFEPYAEQGLVPARVAAQDRGRYVLYAERAQLHARITGRLRHAAESAADLPAVGDWVAVRADGDESAIVAVLPRRTKFSRKAAWAETEEQILAANVDTVFLVSALSGDFNLRRLERYLTMAWESGANPVVALTKADLCADVPGALAAAGAVAIGVPVHAVSCVTREGLDELASHLRPAHTVALLGSSGVGKSTLVNAWAGSELLATNAVRADGRGRHTTTRRELVVLPGGALVLDTPGLRELQLWDADEGIHAAFDDIGALAANCRFRDCSHKHEPGCAVTEALREGLLEPERLQSYRQLERELAHLARKQDRRAASEERKKWRALTRSRRKAAW